MPQTISLAGYDYKNGKFVKSKIHVELNDCNTLPGFSQPISQAAFDQMQENFIHDLDQAYQDAATDASKQDILNRTISVTFGKQALQLILAQEGCEGIRFSFAQSFETDKHETLVAQGVALDPTDNTKIIPVMQPPVNTNAQNGAQNGAQTRSALYFEVVPPGTYRDFLANRDNNQVLFMFREKAPA